MQDNGGAYVCVVEAGPRLPDTSGSAAGGELGVCCGPGGEWAAAGGEPETRTSIAVSRRRSSASSAEEASEVKPPTDTTSSMLRPLFSAACRISSQNSVTEGFFSPDAIGEASCFGGGVRGVGVADRDGGAQAGEYAGDGVVGADFGPHLAVGAKDTVFLAGAEAGVATTAQADAPLAEEQSSACVGAQVC